MPDPREPYNRKAPIEDTHRLARYCELYLDFAFGHLEQAVREAINPIRRAQHIAAAREMRAKVVPLLVRLGPNDGERFRGRLRALHRALASLRNSH